MEQLYVHTLEKQKASAFAALIYYANNLRREHNYNGLRELRNMLKGFSDTLKPRNRHRNIRR